MQIDLTNLSQIFIIMFATSFGTVLATKIATKLLEFVEAKTKLTIKEMQRIIEQTRRIKNFNRKSAGSLGYA